MKNEDPSFKVLFESVPGLYLVLDPAFTIITASDDYLSATMTVREEIAGKNLFEVFPDNPDDLHATGVAKLRESLQTVLRDKMPHTMQVQKYDIRRADGTFEERSWKPLNKPVLNEKNEVAWIIHRVEDVTEAMQLEKQLRISEEVVQSEKKFRSMIENNQEAISLFNANFEPVYRSPSTARISGYTMQEITEKNGVSRLHPADSEKVQQLLKEVAANPGKSFPISFRQLHKAGHYIWMEGTLTNLLHDEGVQAIISNMRDVTARKKHEEQLILFSSIINFSDDAIISSDAEGNITSWNAGAENLFGWLQEEALGKPIFLIIPDHKKQEELEILKNIREGKFVRHYETQRVKKDGSIVLVSLTASPIKNSEDMITGASKISRDITGLKKASNDIVDLNDALKKRATDLQESNLELERFAFIASHDLQEPLRMVTSFLQLLEKRYAAQLDATANQYIHFAVDGAERMKKLIQDLLEYSRVGVNRDDYSSINLDQLVSYACSVFNDRIISSGARLTIGKLPVIQGGKVQLTQLFQNLLSNAIKYKSQRPLTIEIGCIEKRQEWEFFITDNGIGIDPKFNEKIFIIFQRLHNRSEYAGTGIGLSICKKIVERHGGKMWVESSLDVGSTFRFTIPK
jgi:PAS domain S-box-containing protein